MASPHYPGAFDDDPQAQIRILTERELQVLKLMAEGLSTNAIAKRLGIAFKTAACHRYGILDKLGVDNTVCALRWAVRNGVINP